MIASVTMDDIRKNIQLNVMLPKDQMEWLNERTKGTRLTRSDIVRLLIDDAMDKDQKVSA